MSVGNIVLIGATVLTFGGLINACDGCAKARNADAELDALGRSIGELETIPVGALVKFEGELDPDAEQFKGRLGLPCVAEYVLVETISYTTDSDDDRTYYSKKNFLEKRSPKVLNFRRGKNRLAVRRRAWDHTSGASRARLTAWPSFLGRQYQLRYRGKLDGYRVSSRCLQRGNTYFVAGGRVADVTDAARLVDSEETSELLEVIKPIIWVDGHEPHVSIWNGSEKSRISALTDSRKSNRARGRIGLAVAGVVIFLGLAGWWRSH